MTAIDLGHVGEEEVRSGGMWAAARMAPFPAMIFVVLLMMPPETSVKLGELRISPYRWVLLFTLPVALYKLLLLREDRLTLVDGLVAAHAFWVILAITVTHDAVKGAASGGIYLVESLGAFLLARVYVRTTEEFRSVVGVLALCVLMLMLVSIPEMVTGKHYARDFARSILGGTPPDEMGQRLGLTRAYGPFEHPILYGIFCAASIGLTRVAFASDKAFAIWPAVRTGLLFLATFASVSSGAMAVAAIQLGMIAWGRVTATIPGRWLVLAVVCVMGIVAVSSVSTRSPIAVLITTLSLSPETGYMRMEIFNYGSAEVERNPVWGIGFNDWERPDWMPDTGSVDNFWLLTAMRFGLPALVLLGLAMAVILFRAGRAKLSGDAAELRTAVLIALVGIALAGCTVHFWNALFSLFFFLLGCSAWTWREENLEEES